MKRRIRLLLCFLWASSIFGASPLLAETDRLPTIKKLQETLAAVADNVRPSVVAIRAVQRVQMMEEFDQQAAATQPGNTPPAPIYERIIPAIGSGVIFDECGLVLTNEHVIQDARPEDIECVLYNGLHCKVRGLTTDPRSDLAVLRIEHENVQPAQLSDLQTVKQGHFVVVMGNPFGMAYENRGGPALSFGVVSSLGQVLTHELDPLDQRYYGNLIQTDAPINPGNSGGPLINLNGEVIGLTTAIATRTGGSQGVGYAIAIDQRTKKIIRQLSRGEPVRYGYLGVRLRELTETERQSIELAENVGALVEDVQLNTPAAEAGLQAGDVLYRYNNRQIKSVDQLIRWVGASPVGKNASLWIYRNRKAKEVPVKLGMRDAPAGSHYEQPYTCCGLTLSDVDQRLREKYGLLKSKTRCVVITDVSTGSPAEKAGLRSGQVIESINDQSVASVRRLHCGLAAKPLKLTLAAHPDRKITLP
jgi:serine protease Do